MVLGVAFRSDAENAFYDDTPVGYFHVEPNTPEYIIPDAKVTYSHCLPRLRFLLLFRMRIKTGFVPRLSSLIMPASGYVYVCTQLNFVTRAKLRKFQWNDGDYSIFFCVLYVVYVAVVPVCVKGVRAHRAV